MLGRVKHLMKCSCPSDHFLVFLARNSHPYRRPNVFCFCSQAATQYSRCFRHSEHLIFLRISLEIGTRGIQAETCPCHAIRQRQYEGRHLQSATTMLRPRFPAELLDQIVDHLHDTSDALKRCCLVSKSWVPRTRRHLFADVNFRTEKDLRSWKNAFPDPSTSPACYTKNLIWCPEAVVAADTEEHGLIPAFSRVVHFEVGISGSEASLIPFHGFSPALKSLRITCTGLTSSPILNFLHSFPLVEDFSVIACDTLLIDNADEQPTIIQPPLTGALKLSAFGGMDSIISRLFFPSNGIRFQKLELSLNCEEDVQPISALVEACCLTLEFLEISVGIYGTSVWSVFPYQWLISVCRRAPAGSYRPVYSDWTQICSAWVEAQSPMGGDDPQNNHAQTQKSPTNLAQCKMGKLHPVD